MVARKLDERPLSATVKNQLMNSRVVNSRRQKPGRFGGLWAIVGSVRRGAPTVLRDAPPIRKMSKRGGGGDALAASKQHFPCVCLSGLVGVVWI